MRLVHPNWQLLEASGQWPQIVGKNNVLKIAPYHSKNMQFLSINFCPLALGATQQKVNISEYQLHHYCPSLIARKA